MPVLNGRVPKYRLHRNSGRATVTLNDRDHYLGPYGSQVSKDEYDRLVAEWLAGGRHLASPDAKPRPISINRIVQVFWAHALKYYRRPDGSPTGEEHNYRDVLRPLRRLYGRTAAVDFGPRALDGFRQHLITLGWNRKVINRQVHRICSVFKYAASQEMIPVAIYQQLKTLTPLKRGRTEAVEPAPVRPVPDEYIQAIRPFVSRQVWALIQLQLLTAARAGELVSLRGSDLKTGEKIWILEPQEHKTAHHGHAKRIYFGPQAQAIVQEYLRDRPLDRYLFSPAEAEAERRQEQHAARKTPLSYGNRPGSNRRAQPQRHPTDHYTVASFRRAIERACGMAYPPPENLARQKVKGTKRVRRETRAEWRQRLGPEAWAELHKWRRAHHWHPHRLRHNAGTYLRKEFGIEMARIILGHRSPSMTELYAEVDDQKAKEIMRKIG